MTGLDPERCVILEIATLVTDAELRVLGEGPDLAIHWDEDVLTTMHPWCIEQHGRSGLTQQCRQSTVDLGAAESQTLAFLQGFGEAGLSPLCGNTIGQDRRFLVRHMPKLEAFFHYRSVDVSTIKELAKRWYPDLPPYRKKEGHRALQDIYESVEELRYYRANCFK